jgi:hypothetical protein
MMPSKTKDPLVRIADALEKIAESMIAVPVVKSAENPENPENTESTQPKIVPLKNAPVAASEEELSTEDVRKVLVQIGKTKGGPQKCKALIKDIGAASLGKVPLEDLPKLLAAAEKVLNDG